MKKISVLLVLLFSSVFSALAQTPVIEPVKSPTVTVSASYNSNYLAFGAGIELWDQPCVQGSITVNFDNGLYIFLWGSSDMEDNPGSSLADEIDLGIGWAGTIGKGWNLDVGLTYFDEPHNGHIARFGAEDILYTKVKLGHDIGKGWAASAIWESYTTLPNTGYKGGSLLGIELSKTFKLSGRVSVPFSVGGIYDDGGFDFAQGWLIRGNLGMDVTLTPSLTMNLGGRYYLPFMDDTRENDVMAYAGLTWKH